MDAAKIKSWIADLGIPEKYSSITSFLETTYYKSTESKNKLAKSLQELDLKVAAELNLGPVQELTEVPQPTDTGVRKDLPLRLWQIGPGSADSVKGPSNLVDIKERAIALQHLCS